MTTIIQCVWSNYHADDDEDYLPPNWMRRWHDDDNDDDDADDDDVDDDDLPLWLGGRVTWQIFRRLLHWHICPPLNKYTPCTVNIQTQ